MRQGPTKPLLMLLAAPVLAILVWMFSFPAQPVAALAPVQTAWWNTANSSAAPAPVPPPPDVDTSKHDLYINGAAGTAGPTPTPPPPLPAPPTVPTNAQGGVQALSAIRYEIPDGAAVESLTLQVKVSPAPTQPPTPAPTSPPTAPPPTVVACAITASNFKAEDNGPTEDIPTYDCTVQAVGTVAAAGDAVTFPDIGRLTHGAVLQFVLVPGQADRLVFLHPDAASLTVSGGVPAGATGPGSVPPYSSSGGTSPGGAAYNAPAISTPAGEPPLPAPLSTNPRSSGSSRTLPVATTAPTLPPSSAAARLVVGLAALASIGAFAGMILLGPRMDLRSVGAQAGGATNVRGIGRFSEPRAGRPPGIS